MVAVLNRQLPPPQKDIDLARDSARVLALYAKYRHKMIVRLGEDDSERGREVQIELPESAVQLLLDILNAMASGQGITLIPENAELTTVQAANILHVSRPFLIKLLENGEIPYKKVGKHRRIRIEDVVDYKTRIDAKRRKALDQLVEESIRLDLDY